MLANPSTPGWVDRGSMVAQIYSVQLSHPGVDGLPRSVPTCHDAVGVGYFSQTGVLSHVRAKVLTPNNLTTFDHIWSRLIT